MAVRARDRAPCPPTLSTNAWASPPSANRTVPRSTPGWRTARPGAGTRDRGNFPRGDAVGECRGHRVEVTQEIIDVAGAEAALVIGFDESRNLATDFTHFPAHVFYHAALVRIFLETMAKVGIKPNVYFEQVVVEQRLEPGQARRCFRKISIRGRIRSFATTASSS